MVNILQVYVNMWRHMFNPKGRTGRYDYWISIFLDSATTLFISGIYLIVYEVAVAKENILVLIISTAVSAVLLFCTIIINLLLHWRRYHDVGKPGWLWLLHMSIPVIGVFIALYYTVKRSDIENQWGIKDETINKSHMVLKVIYTVVVYLAAMLLFGGTVFAKVSKITKGLKNDAFNYSSNVYLNGNTEDNISSMDDAVLNDNKFSSTEGWEHIIKFYNKSLALLVPEGSENLFSNDSVLNYSIGEDYRSAVTIVMSQAVALSEEDAAAYLEGEYAAYKQKDTFNPVYSKDIYEKEINGYPARVFEATEFYAEDLYFITYGIILEVEDREYLQITATGTSNTDFDTVCKYIASFN